MKSVSLMAGGFVLIVGMFSVPDASAQFKLATAGKDYSFTISTAQPWTDTGVELQSGDVLQFQVRAGSIRTAAIRPECLVPPGKASP